MIERKLEKLGKFAFEFLTISISIFAAFALDNWNDNRKDRITEIKILTEIKNGLKQDIKDINLNENGHKKGLLAAKYFINIANNKEIRKDSITFYYFNLFRDFISVQNISGYETLKSKGLEIIENDSLRSEIISLYENDYNSLRKLEENYSELQIHQNYFKEITSLLSTNFNLNENGSINDIQYPINLPEKEKKNLLVDLWRIEQNRIFMINTYSEVKEKINKLQKNIETLIEK